MARKVFISVLGTGFYDTCKYVNPTDKFISSETHFVQHATLEYIKANEWTSDDVILILLTKKAREDNWDKTITKRFDVKSQSEKPYIRLESIIDRMNLRCKTTTLSIPDGIDETEMWRIFTILFDALKDEDELYFDLTHSFRYLPMLLLVLGNYAKFLKAITVKHISYGNYEARNKETNEAPIVDLLSLSQLQDWTFAAGQYLDSGNVEKLTELSNKEIKPILAKTKGSDASAKNLKSFITSLNSVIEERQTCRGISIIKSENIKKLKENADNIESTFITPLNPIFNKIKSSLIYFDEQENVKNGFASAVWCYNNGLLQQSATILQEFVVSFFCLRHNIPIDDEKQRELINSAFAIKFNHLEETKWKGNEKENKEIKTILIDDLFDNNELISLFNNLTEVRNDLNHSGMRSKRAPLSVISIKDNILKCINGFAKILYNIKTISSC